MSAGPDSGGVTPQDREEAAYVRGHRMAWFQILGEALRQLGYEDAAANGARWVREREEAVTALRSVCDVHGDNDWDERLNLADVIEKHLHRHLEAP